MSTKPLSAKDEAKIDSLLNSILVPRYVDFSKITEIRKAVDCDGYWKRAIEKEKKKDQIVEALPDMGGLKIQEENRAPAVVDKPDFSDLAIMNPSQRLREKARRRSQQITVEPEQPRVAPQRVASMTSKPNPSTAKPILSARDRRVRPAEAPTTSVPSHPTVTRSSSINRIAVPPPPSAPITRSMARRSASNASAKDSTASVSNRYEPYSTTTRSSSIGRGAPLFSAPVMTRSMARRSASNAGANVKESIASTVRTRRSESVKSDVQPSVSRRSDAAGTAPVKSGLSRRSSNVMSYLSEKISTISTVANRIRSASRGRI